MSAVLPECPTADDPVLADLVERLTAHLAAGAAVDLDAFLADCPGHADEVRRLWPALRVLASLSRSRDADPRGADVPSLAEQLDDFRLVRELGRGGMGIVYEAEQISLNRRVALKVLPFAATTDPRRMQRFHNETRAAASLHHPNIVPVFAVGCAAGVPYFAMPLIDGRTLAAHIAERRSGVEWFRRAARWGVEAAEALEHAHQLGVVHRDVKPANLLVDATGRLWVTDFGLAHCAGDPALTLSGDLVGTLRYMSPEQALARPTAVDHRTDVYALGATLYELLVGMPAVPGRGREEVLRQIAHDEPRPPRRLDPAVPADLETIALKALTKSPDERYPTAQALADDLRRFLDDRPIRARPPTPVQKARRFLRRHRPVVVSLAATTAVALAVGSAVSGGLALRAIRAERAALARAAEAEEARRRAEADRAVAVLLFEVAPPGLESSARTWLLKGAADPESMLAIAQALVAKYPDNEQAWKLLAVAYDATERHAEALAHFRRAVRTRDHCARSHNRLAWLLATCRDAGLRDPAGAVAHAERATALDPNTAWYWNTLGAAYYRSEKYTEAVAALERSLALKWDDGFNSYFLAMTYARLGRAGEARRWHALALKNQEAALPIAGEELRRLRSEADAVLGLGRARSGAE